MLQYGTYNVEDLSVQLCTISEEIALNKMLMIEAPLRFLTQKKQFSFEQEKRSMTPQSYEVGPTY